MHISDGVLDARICIGGYVAAAGLVAYASTKVKREDIPRISVMGAAFFVASLLHIRIGITSVHPLLVGLMGAVLGVPAVLAVVVGLFFQAVMFGHGGLSTLGVNAVIMGLSALAATGMFVLPARRWSGNHVLLSVVAGVTAALAIFVGTALTVAVVLLGGYELRGLAVYFTAAHLVLAGVEGVLTGFVVRQILRIKPEMLLRPGRTPA